jgi:hypothetical protein
MFLFISLFQKKYEFIDFINSWKQVKSMNNSVTFSLIYQRGTPSTEGTDFFKSNGKNELVNASSCRALCICGCELEWNL